MLAATTASRSSPIRSFRSSAIAALRLDTSVPDVHHPLRMTRDSRVVGDHDDGSALFVKMLE